MNTWTTQDTLTFIVLPLVTVVVIPVIKHILDRQKEHGKTLSDHGDRLTKVEGLITGVADGVKRVEGSVDKLTGETKTQTRMLDRLLGKMGLGLDGIDRGEG